MRRRAALRAEAHAVLGFFADVDITDRCRGHNDATALAVGELERCAAHGIGDGLSNSIGRQVGLQGNLARYVLHANSYFHVCPPLVPATGVTNYRRGMSRRSEGLFAGRGIPWRPIAVTVIVVVVAFAAGIGVGWGTGKVPALYLAATSPSASPSASLEPSASPSVSVAPLGPITRDLTSADAQAGVRTTVYTFRGDETFTPIPGEGEPVDNEGPVRLVRIDVEDGIDVDAGSFAEYVMSILNDPRGWGSEGRLQFVQTQGVPDLRVVLASPYTAALMCPSPHAVGRGVAAAVEPSAGEADASPSASASPTSSTCADRGAGAISQYDWIAGLPGYGDDVVGARQYLISHGSGHILGEAEATCAGGTALVMVDQRDAVQDCDVNPWPFPDAELAPASPSPEASASS